MKKPSKNAPGGNSRHGAFFRFWFQRTDPTTLGFMRIIVGLVAIYVHLAYCFDLQAFFGPDGFWNQRIANRERQEFPVGTETWSWDPPKMAIATPQMIDRRVAVFDFLKHLPAEKAERDSVLTYLDFLLENYGISGQPIAENNFDTGLLLVKKVVALFPEDRAKVEEALARDAVDAKSLPITLPDFFLAADPATRLKMWADMLRFAKYLPAAEVNFDYVIFWLTSMTADDRGRLKEFLAKLPEGAEGSWILDYLETWRQDPRLAVDRGRYIFSFWFHVSSPSTIWALHFLCIGIFVLFTIGLFTRVMSVLAWVASVSYMHRTQQVLFGMDTMMNILLFYLMIGPSGAALSVDRLIARYRAARARLAARGDIRWAEAVLAGPRPSSVANFVVRLFQIHFCFIYLASGLAKLKGGTWWSQYAAWGVLANPEFCPVQYQYYQWFLRELVHYRPLMAAAFASVVYFTLFMEISLPFLIWTRLRPVLVIGAVLLHTGIAWVMGLTCFGLLMMTLLLCYVPAATIRQQVGWPAGFGPKFTLRFSSRDSRQRRVASLLQALDLTGQMTLHDEGSKKVHETMEVQLVSEDGSRFVGFDAVRQAIRTLVLGGKLACLLWVPGVSILLRSLTDGPPRESWQLEEVKPSVPTARTPAGS